MRFGLWLSIVLLLVVCLFGAALWAAHTWSIETIDPDTATGYNCLALDSLDRPHISYSDAGGSYLKYARFDGTIWQLTNVDGDGILSWETSLALDSSDYPHISYYGYFPLGDEWARELRYARWDGSDWDDIQTVDRSANFVGQYNSLALDALDRPRIAYCDATSGAWDLKYAKWISGTTWQVETVDSADTVGRRCALALDSSGNAHIAYEDMTNHRLKYAEWTGSAWSFSKTIETYGVQPSLVLDGSDCPHIAYTNYDTKNLHYVVWNGTSWDPPQTVDGSGPDAYPCLALGPGDLPGIVYCVGWVGTSDVKYAEWNPTTETWDIETVDAGRAGKIEVWLALTAAGEPQITFTDGRIFPVDYTDLLYASATGPLAARWPR